MSVTQACAQVALARALQPAPGFDRQPARAEQRAAGDHGRGFSLLDLRCDGALVIAARCAKRVQSVSHGLRAQRKPM